MPHLSYISPLIFKINIACSKPWSTAYMLKTKRSQVQVPFSQACTSRSLQPLLEKPGKESSFPWNFVILREKIKKCIREICYAGGKFCPVCREINIFSRPVGLNQLRGSHIMQYRYEYYKFEVPLKILWSKGTHRYCFIWDPRSGSEGIWMCIL